MTYREDPGRRVDPQTGDDIWDFPKTGGTQSSGNSGSGSSGGSGGSSTDTTGDGPDGPADYTDNEATRFNGLPGKPEVWKDEDGTWYVVYFPESGPQPPVPLLFEISTDEELKSLFGNKDPVADKTLTAEELTASGAVPFGEMASIDRYNASNELIDDPWAGFTSRMERAMESMPWLAEDPEVFALVAGAYLEGRELEAWELEQTDYYQSHSKGERDAMRLQLSDPQGYADRQDAYESTIYDEVAKFGIDPNADIVNYIAKQYNSGLWTLDQSLSQVRAYADGGGTEELDADFSAYIEEQGFEAGGATTGISEVHDLFAEWLGPAFPPGDQDISDWATRFRDDPAGARAALTEHLREQRKVLFPSYEDENTTYRQAAAPWKSYTQNVWGIPLDETDPVFQSIVQANDPVEAQKMAREAGSERGYTQVVKTMASDIQRSMRQGVRGAV
jgi:hypothetical protein